MRGTRLLGLSLTCALFIGALTYTLPQSAPEPSPAEPWLAQLKVGTVMAIVIATPGQSPIRAERRDGRWVLASWQDFPAAPSAIVNLLRAIDNARQVEAQSSLTEHREFLGLDDQASHLTLERQDQAPLELWLGKQVLQGGQIVRIENDPTPWLLDTNLPLPQSPAAWIDRHLTRIPYEQIRRLSLTYPNGVRVKISRDSADQLRLKVSQHPIKVMNETEANDLARLFAQLKIEEVAPVSDFEKMKKPGLDFELLTFSGDKLSGQIRQRDDQYWIKLKARKGFEAQATNHLINRALRIESSLLR